MRKILLPLILLIIIVACGGKPQVLQPEQDEKLDTGAVVIAVLPTVDCMPLFIAKERGLFESENLKIALRQYSAQMDIDTALTGTSAKGAMTDLFRAERMKAGGLSLEYATKTESRWWLISNRNVRLNKLEQFGDKMVAMTRFSATDYLTDQAFDSIKTTAPFFKVQINDVFIRLNMILNNEMDAAWLPEPQATLAEAAGHKRMKTKPAERFGVIAFNAKYLKEKQKEDFAKRFCAAYSAACDSLNKNGLAAYAAELRKYCNTDTAALRGMKKTTFAPAAPPSGEAISIARKAATQSTTLK